jgi:hypothetical protein
MRFFIMCQITYTAPPCPGASVPSMLKSIHYSPDFFIFENHITPYESEPET